MYITRTLGTLNLMDIKDLHEYKWSCELLTGPWLNDLVYCLFTNVWELEYFALHFLLVFFTLFSHRCVGQELVVPEFDPIQNLGWQI